MNQQVKFLLIRFSKNNAGEALGSSSSKRYIQPTGLDIESLKSVVSESLLIVLEVCLNFIYRVQPNFRNVLELVYIFMCF